MTISGAMTYNRYRVRRNTTESGFSFEARNDQVSQTLLIPGLDRLNPLDLFSAGQPGGFADPYDLTKMWVDDAGTTPATIASLGTGIGRVVTKGHTPITLVQANAADRPVWGRHPVSGIRNLLDNSNKVDGSPWTTSIGGTGVSPVRTSNAAIAPDGTMTASRVDFDRGAGNTISDASRLIQTFATSVNGQYTQSIWMKAASSSDIGKQIGLRNVGGASYGAITLTDNWVRYTRTETGSLSNFELASRGTFTADNQVSVLLWEGQLEAGSTATTNQAVTNRFDITEVGSPSLYYFSGNGVNQEWASNATVDFSAVEKMTVWAGVQRLSDAARGTIFELTASTDSNNGAFHMTGPNAASSTYGWESKGTAVADVVVTSALSARRSLVGVGDISGDLARLIVDGVASDDTGDQGSGNYSNATLNVFSRGGSSQFFNGRLYSLIIAGGLYDSRTVSRFADYTLKPRRLITA